MVECDFFFKKVFRYFGIGLPFPFIKIKLNKSSPQHIIKLIKNDRRSQPNESIQMNVSMYNVY